MKLTSQDHQNLTAFLGAVLDEYHDGTSSRDDAIGALEHVIAAIALGNVAEARTWLQQGRKFLEQLRQGHRPHQTP
jgi:hypothetical protein